MAQPPDGIGQYNKIHICLEQNPWMITDEALYTGISITAMKSLTIWLSQL